MDKYNKLIKEYGIYHTKLITKITHILGIPLIVLAIFIFISWLTINVDQSLRIHLVYLFTIILSIYYIKIHLKFGLILTIFFILYHFHFLTTQITAATYAHNRSVTYISNKFTHVYLQRRDTFNLNIA
jgi:uncharacterized membrane protein YGL010W